MTEQPVRNEAGFRRRGRTLTVLTAANAALLLIAWLTESYVAERFRLLVWLTYVPQHPLGVPLVLLALWSTLARRWRHLAINGGAAVFFALTFLGFNIPFGRTTEPGTLRVLTVNTHAGMQGVERIARLIEAQKPDVVCLQETAPFRGFPDPLPGILARSPGWEIARAAEVTTLSRHPIVRRKAHTMLPEMGRSALETTLKLPAGDVTVFNVHYNTAYAERPDPGRDDLPRMSYRSMARWEQTSILFEAVEAVDGPVIVAGDFNNPPRGINYRRLTRRFTDAFRAAGWGFGYTLRSDLPVMRIDYIFTSADMGVTRCEALGVKVSDHRAVVADLTLRP